MPDQQSIDVNGLRQQQLDLENWCRNMGRDRSMANGWQRGAEGSLFNKLAAGYLSAVMTAWERGKTKAGKQGHIWALMPKPQPVKIVALEALHYVIGSCGEKQSANQLARSIGSRSEYALWLMHDAWGRSALQQGLKLVNGTSLSMKTMQNRLKDKGFRKAAAYKPLDRVERCALGMLFLELIQATTGLISIDVENDLRGHKTRMVSMTELYWHYLSNWQQLTQWLRPLRMPMLVPPRPWSSHHDGGYLSMETQITSVPWERWHQVIKVAKPCVLDSINILQEQAYRLDHDIADLLHKVWELGHSIGKVPPRDRLPMPSDRAIKEKYNDPSVGPAMYWKAVWQYKADQRRNGARSQVINSLVSYEKLKSADLLYFVWRMDHRGRLYSRGAQVNPQATDHYRAQLQFNETSPMKGHEPEFAWSLGEAYGMEKDEKARLAFLHDQRLMIEAAGCRPIDHLEFIDEAKEPFRFAQLCMDWAEYRQDENYRTGTIHWLDQTCSGWGHVACLTADHDLAQFTNVVGGRAADLYRGLGKAIEVRIEWEIKHGDNNNERLKNLYWWRDREIPRSLWKSLLMPVIYGKSYMSMEQTVRLYLRDEVKDFVTAEGLKVLQLARTLSQLTHNVVKDTFPHVRHLSHWLGQVADIQMKKDIRPYWYTPNLLAVESYSNVTYTESLELVIGGMTVRVDQREQDHRKFDRRKTKQKLVPDFVHSQDAAFLQRFVSHWKTYDHPISVVHDCFGTTLGSVKTLRAELNDQWARFYSVDYLSRHQGMVQMLTGEPVPDPPVIGTLDRQRLGENPYLFC